MSSEIEKGRHAATDSQFDVALSCFDRAEQRRRDIPSFGDSRSRLAQGRGRQANQGDRDRADALFADGDRLRFLLLFGSDSGDACKSVESALARFSIPADSKWIDRPSIRLLDEPRRTRLVSEVNELLFLWVWALVRDQPGNPSVAREAVRLCDLAMGFAIPIGPWQVIRERSSATLRGEQPSSRKFTLPSLEKSAHGCFQWALLCELQGDPAGALAWLERATSLKENDYWLLMYLGYYHKSTKQIARGPRGLQSRHRSAPRASLGSV